MSSLPSSLSPQVICVDWCRKHLRWARNLEILLHLLFEIYDGVLKLKVILFHGNFVFIWFGWIIWIVTWIWVFLSCLLWMMQLYDGDSALQRNFHRVYPFHSVVLDVCYRQPTEVKKGQGMFLCYLLSNVVAARIKASRIEQTAPEAHCNLWRSVAVPTVSTAVVG